MSSPGECLYDACVPLEKVSPKAAHDYAEIFDGVPSKHDGKDAAIVAELASLGNSSRWKYEPPSEEDAQIAYQVDWIDAQQRQKTMWLDRLEGLLARHWPELTGQLKLSSPTLLQLLCHYGGPSAVAEDAEAAARVGRSLFDWREDRSSATQRGADVWGASGTDREDTDAALCVPGVSSTSGISRRQEEFGVFGIAARSDPTSSGSLWCGDGLCVVGVSGGSV